MTEIFVSVNHILIEAEYRQPDMHKHWAKHMIFSLDKDMICSIGSKDSFSCRGVIIDSNISHTVDSQGSCILVFLFDETTDLAEEIGKRFLLSEGYCVIELDMVLKVGAAWKRIMRAKLDSEDIKQSYSLFYDEVMFYCNIKSKGFRIADSRIIQALSYINNMKCISENSVKELSRKAYLSQSRFSHLFKEQVGISLNSYLVICKLGKAYKYLINGDDITSAALKAGFSSPSHFAAAGKSMLGLTATELSKQCRWIII